LFFVSVGILLDPTSVLDSPGYWPDRRHRAHRQSDRGVRHHVDEARAFRTASWWRGPRADRQFSFILATLGRDLGLFTREATNVLVATSMFSIVVNRSLPRSIDRPMDGEAARRRAVCRSTAPDRQRCATAGHARHDTHRAVLIGFGPTGKRWPACSRKASSPPSSS
jgi:CPA2 family monovalent cation:H+ antiporter-2